MLDGRGVTGIYDYGATAADKLNRAEGLLLSCSDLASRASLLLV